MAATGLLSLILQLRIWVFPWYQKFLLEASTEMPGETRRTLKSSKESSSSANGEKARTDSQSTSSSKDKPVPTRASSSKGKPLPSKKGISHPSGKEGTGDRQTNGTEPAENGVNGTEDVEMADDQIKPGQGNAGEDEMTVGLPSHKGTTLSDAPNKDDGDTAMEDTDKAENDESASETVNVGAKAISGELQTEAIKICACLITSAVTNLNL